MFCAFTTGCYSTLFKKSRLKFSVTGRTQVGHAPNCRTCRLRSILIKNRYCLELSWPKRIVISNRIKSFFISDKIEQANVALPWFLVLRWGESICQALLVIVVSLYIDIDLPLVFLGLIISTGAISNIFLHYRFRRGQTVSSNVIFIIFILDNLLLTGLLHLTGGAMNPFTFLYLVYIVIAAIILPPKWSWLITIHALACYSLLFLPPPVTRDLSGTLVPESVPICHLPGEASGALLLHLKGMWVACAITSFFIVFFVSRIQKDLAIHNETLLSLKETRLRNERLASLTGLAAGAAHELSTPLCTAAIAAGEMIHHLQRHKADRDLIDDALLIKKQVADCKEILYQMAAGAGELRGEELRSFTIDEAVEQILSELGPEEQKRIKAEIFSNRQHLRMGFRTLCRTLKGLLKNGLEASTTADQVRMRWFENDGKMVIEIVDHGKGMSPQVLRQALEPFFSTKPTGMGLGLFLAKTMAEQYGGDVRIDSTAEKGTTATVSLDINRIT